MDSVKRVRDVMIPLEQYPAVRDTATLREAVDVMKTAEIEVDRRKSLPRVLLVFDAIEVLVGYVRRRDIMRGLEPKYLVVQPLEYRKKLFDVAVDPNLSELSYDRVITGIREQASRPVSDVMQPIEAVLQADDHIMKAIYEMVSQDLTLIPVVDGKQLVGVVRSVELFHELVQVLRH
ncbi:MAG: CBS domain-containing protein [Gemmatimonadota bacterium]|nr:CBS domain-containing protein [Gemmatimonadota bacterium]MDH5197045.1 CBS domain-containing protein [Gemmatimonadota bacterium]